MTSFLLWCSDTYSWCLCISFASQTSWFLPLRRTVWLFSLLSSSWGERLVFSYVSCDIFYFKVSFLLPVFVHLKKKNGCCCFLIANSGKKERRVCFWWTCKEKQKVGASGKVALHRQNKMKQLILCGTFQASTHWKCFTLNNDLL